ncbi:hypothetical protein SCHPADRAFT_924430 [Schizopora paradoxa]|uniref:Uncharacterized protein n=1 Tax=Schizopora paradoxa TaxID=27342 RepID=A0A0H2S5J3_9AGAM|nr:hypothetical protein SCHPADRAFT_924430 [Schizopora paradoxa]
MADLPSSYSPPPPETISGEVPLAVALSVSDKPSSFTTPDHPAVKYLETRTLRASQNDSPPPPPPPYEEEETLHDPHAKPTFSVRERRHSILYLPPLISSLPQYVEEASESDDSTPNAHPPLTTETRLPNIDPVSLSLHKALHHFRPYDDKYASRPYAEAFNWSDLKLPVDEEREWYIVAFRSKRKSGSDGTRNFILALYDADKKAHEEAVQNGGLLMYWYGVPDPTTGLNLATCVWQSRQHAIAANSRPHHIQAMKLAKDSYEIYALERHVLRKSAGQTNVTIEPYEGGDVGW